MAKAYKILRRIDPKTGKRILLADKNLNLLAEAEEDINSARRLFTNSVMKLLALDGSCLTIQQRRRHKRITRQVMKYLEELSGPDIVRRLIKKYHRSASDYLS